MLNEETLPAVNDEMEPDMEGAMAAESLAKNLTAGGIPKNFRQQADIESFYRFVHENDLREEALTILDEVRARKELAASVKGRVKH